MEIKPIKNDFDHNEALKEIERLWGIPESSPDSDKLEILVTLVDAYEDKRWPINDPDPVDAIKAAMAHDGHTAADLARLIGKSRASEILKRKRSLTLPMIRKIAHEWHVPERLLVRAYSVAI